MAGLPQYPSAGSHPRFPEAGTAVRGNHVRAVPKLPMIPRVVSGAVLAALAFTSILYLPQTLFLLLLNLVLLFAFREFFQLLEGYHRRNQFDSRVDTETATPEGTSLSLGGTETRSDTIRESGRLGWMCLFLGLLLTWIWVFQSSWFTAYLFLAFLVLMTLSLTISDVEWRFSLGRRSRLRSLLFRLPCVPCGFLSATAPRVIADSADGVSSRHRSVPGREALGEASAGPSDKPQEVVGGFSRRDGFVCPFFAALRQHFPAAEDPAILGPVGSAAGDGGDDGRSF